jgi:error-prone DNA polymerase
MAANDITPDKIEPGPFFPDALRLGMRMVNGLSEAAAGRIVRARARQAFVDTQDLARRAKLDRHDLHALARAGALETLAGHRREALWHVTGTHMPPPLFEHVALQEERATLAPPTEAQDIVADYGSLGLTLRRHPLALLRAELTRRRLLTAKELCGLTHGKLARAAGIVTGRQRPDTASGVIFVTLEDETGHTNVVVWRTVAERQRRQLLGARLLAVYGTIEREGDVVHLVAAHLIDLSELLGTLVPKSRDFH